MTNELETTDPSIKIFLEYEYLTAGQLATIVSSIDSIYAAAVDALIFPGFDYHNGPGVIKYPIPLCVTRADTSNSIELTFSLVAAAAPSVTIVDGAIRVALPQWAAAVTVAFLAAQYCLRSYKEFLEVEKLQLEVRKLHLEVATLEESVSHRIQEAQHRLSVVILQKNITTVRINEQSIK
jgi:hypothetical protein